MEDQFDLEQSIKQAETEVSRKSYDFFIDMREKYRKHKDVLYKLTEKPRILKRCLKMFEDEMDQQIKKYGPRGS